MTRSLVVRANDDGDPPTIGEVVSVGSEAVWVVWGALRHADHAAEFACREFVDDVVPWEGP